MNKKVLSMVILGAISLGLLVGCGNKYEDDWKVKDTAILSENITDNEVVDTLKSISNRIEVDFVIHEGKISVMHLNLTEKESEILYFNMNDTKFKKLNMFLYQMSNNIGLIEDTTGLIFHLYVEDSNGRTIFQVDKNNVDKKYE